MLSGSEHQGILGQAQLTGGSQSALLTKFGPLQLFLPPLHSTPPLLARLKITLKGKRLSGIMEIQLNMPWLLQAIPLH
jgi:hypothetical protein